MKWFILLASVSLIAYPVRAEYSARVRAYIEMSGTEFETPAKVMMVRNSNSAEVKIVRWKYDTLPRPTEAMLPTEQEAAAWAAAKAVVAEEAKQAAKSPRRKQLENKFLSLNEEVLAFVNDPRTGSTPPVKVPVGDLTELLSDFMESANPGIEKKAMKLSIRLLNADVQLRKLDPDWWDDAAQHTLE